MDRYFDKFFSSDIGVIESSPVYIRIHNKRSASLSPVPSNIYGGHDFFLATRERDTRIVVEHLFLPQHSKTSLAGKSPPKNLGRYPNIEFLGDHHDGFLPVRPHIPHKRSLSAVGVYTTGIYHTPQDATFPGIDNELSFCCLCIIMKDCCVREVRKQGWHFRIDVTSSQITHLVEQHQTEATCLGSTW